MKGKEIDLPISEIDDVDFKILCKEVVNEYGMDISILKQYNIDNPNVVYPINRRYKYEENGYSNTKIDENNIPRLLYYGLYLIPIPLQLDNKDFTIHNKSY